MLLELTNPIEENILKELNNPINNNTDQYGICGCYITSKYSLNDQKIRELVREQLNTVSSSKIDEIIREELEKVISEKLSSAEINFKHRR